MNINRLLFVNIFLACLVGILALTLPALVMKQLDILIDKPIYRHLIQSCLTGFIAITGVWYLRSRTNSKTPISIGLVKVKTALTQFIFGFGLIAVPLIITIIAGVFFGWAELSLNINNGVLWLAVLGMISTFFTDAITEELIFRGYIFGNLKVRFNTWISSLITLGVFVMLPVVINSIHNALNIDGFVPVNGGYIITLIFFGSFVQYLRVLTKSIWTGVGFHLLFVQMNQLMGLEGDKLIEFSETSNQQPFQITLIILLLIVFIGLIIYPIIKKRK